MKKFKFRFETVHSVKEKMKDKAKKELAEISIKIESLKGIVRELESAVIKTKKSVSLNKYKVNELQNMERHVIFLKNEISKMLEDIEKLKIRKSKKLNELVERSKDVKIFETLYDKHHEIYLNEQKKAELLMLDELAIQKAGRKAR